MRVHSELGPGLLESAYHECLQCELEGLGLQVDSEFAVEVTYRGRTLNCAYRIDLVVERTLALELKSVSSLQPIHNAQMLTYLRLSRLPVGLLMNFNVPQLRLGIRRFVRPPD
ncbi:MAG: GxxExxY protein [Planctomycetota bacterium]|nr:GxxExxY protein [Planctomycetota bacterium]